MAANTSTSVVSRAELHDFLENILFGWGWEIETHEDWDDMDDLAYEIWSMIQTFAEERA